MIFQERKTETGYHYRCEDIFGEVDIETEAKLEAGLLDDVVSFLLKQNLSAREVKGEATTEAGLIKYRFVKADQWSDDDEDACDDTPTSKSEQESGSLLTWLSSMPIIGWCRKFVVAFREAWRNVHRG